LDPQNQTTLSTKKTTASSNIFRNLFKSILDNYKDFQEVYTDGSKTHKDVGFAIIFPKKKKIVHKLPNICSIFTAEALAILMAIEIIIYEARSKFIILSDLLSTIKNVYKTNSTPVILHLKSRTTLTKLQFWVKISSSCGYPDTQNHPQFPDIKRGTPICQICGTAITVKHLITDCLRFNQVRVIHRISHNLDTTLGPNHENIFDIINFMKLTKLFNFI
ncbi:hypothetical protein AGLY_016712, partial [Aphis glycines]